MTEPEGREGIGHQAKPCEAIGTVWVLRCYVESLAIYPLAAQRSSDHELRVGGSGRDRADGEAFGVV